MEATPFYIEYLRNELGARCQANPRYSMRAFSRSLSIEPSSLSQILRARRVPTPKTALKLAAGLTLRPAERRKFFRSMAESANSRGRLSFGSLVQPAEEAPPTLTQDHFAVISEWQHFAILALTHDSGFSSDPRWISGELGISPAVARISVDRLLALGLLSQKGKRLTATEKRLAVADPASTSTALRSYQRQILEKAIVALDNIPINERSMTSMTLSADPRKLEAAKEKIRLFQRELSEFLESGPERVVFQLGVSLYPMQTRSKSK